MADILLLDGDCGMCNSGALFLKPRLTKPDSLRFVAIESEEGAKIVSNLPEKMRNEDSVFLIRDGRPFMASAASVRLLLYMRWWWRPLFPLLWLVPLPIRDLVYRFVAKRRRSWFKPPETCAF
jgi:predicted DCC family thiol-disulfide oxidoreductase YuxK